MGMQVRLWFLTQTHGAFWNSGLFRKCESNKGVALEWDMMVGEIEASCFCNNYLHHFGSNADSHTKLEADGLSGLWCWDTNEKGTAMKDDLVRRYSPFFGHC